MMDLFRTWPDALGPLGFKALSMEQDGVRSALASFAWDGPLARMAACTQCGALTPGQRCTCGLHASYSAGHVLDQYMQYRERFLVVVEAQGAVILHEHGWRAELCAVHAIVELYEGNIVKHMMHVRAARCLGDPPLIPLEDAIGIVQEQHWRTLQDGDWQASWRTDPGAFAATCPSA
jgi:hypothetical protein